MISPSPEESNQPPITPTTIGDSVTTHPSTTCPKHEPPAAAASVVIIDPSLEPVVKSCKDWKFGVLGHGKEMGSCSFGVLCGGEVDKVEAVISALLTKERRILDNVGVDWTTGVARGSELCCEDSGKMRMMGSEGEGFGREVEVFGLELKGMHLLSDLEKGFVEDDKKRCCESEISPLEMEKKQLLGDLESGCVFGGVVGTRVLENEDASEGTVVVLDKFCDANGIKKVAKELRTRKSRKMKGGDDGNEGFDPRRSLKIEVIDDTAVVEQVLVREVRGMVKKEIGIRSGLKNQKEVVDGEKGVDGKKVRRAQRKAKSFQGSKEPLGKQENANACSQKSQARRKRMYSIKEMEALRFVNVIEQRRFWRRVYDGLGPVAKDYVSLLSCYNKNYQYAQPGSNFDCTRRSLRRKRPPGILGVMAGSRRGNHHLNIFVPPNMIKTLYAANWSYIS